MALNTRGLHHGTQEGGRNHGHGKNKEYANTFFHNKQSTSDSKASPVTHAIYILVVNSSNAVYFYVVLLAGDASPKQGVLFQDAA